MNTHYKEYLFLFIAVIFASCKKGNDNNEQSSLSGGVLSSEVISYSQGSMTLKTRFFINGTGNLASMTESDISGMISINSLEVRGDLQEVHKVNTSASTNYSIAVLVDNLVTSLTYDYSDNISNPEIFIRKFFKNAGINNKFLLSFFEDKPSPVTIYGNGFTDNAPSLDLILASKFNDVLQPERKADSVPLLESLDYMLDFINANAPTGNRNLLLLYSNSGYNLNSALSETIINKAKIYGVAVSTFLYTGDINYFTIDNDDDDLYYRLAYETGGTVYISHLSLYAEDLLPLASPLISLMQKDYSCFEATWNIVPYSQSSYSFSPGYFAKPDMDVSWQTGSGENLFEMPFAITIK